MLLAGLAAGRDARPTNLFMLYKWADRPMNKCSEKLSVFRFLFSMEQFRVGCVLRTITPVEWRTGMPALRNFS